MVNSAHQPEPGVLAIHHATGRLVQEGGDAGRIILGTGFFVHSADDSDPVLLTAYHCIAEALALEAQDSILLELEDGKSVALKLTDCSDHVSGDDFAVFATSPRGAAKEALKCADLALADLMTLRCVARGAAGGFGTRYTSLWASIAGVETLTNGMKSRLNRDAPTVLQLDTSSQPVRRVRGLSGSPVCVFPQGLQGPPYVIGMVREVAYIEDLANMLYAVPMEAVRRAVGVISATRPRMLPGESETSDSRVVRMWLDGAIERWRLASSPLLPVNVALPTVAVRLRIRAAVGKVSSGYLRALPKREGVGRDYDLEEVLQSTVGPDAVFVVGDPGSGKSTLLAMTAAGLASAYIGSEGRSFPVLVTAKEVAGAGTIAGAMGLRLAQVTVRDLTALVDEIAAAGRLALLVDGLDEVTRSERELVLATCTSIRNRSSSNRLVVACRKVGFRPAEGFVSCEVEALSLEQQREFLLQVCPSAVVALVLRNLGGSPELRDLASFPLTLSVIALVASELLHSEANEDIFGKRSELLIASIRLLLEGRHRATGVADPVAALSILGEASFRLQDALERDECVRREAVENAISRAMERNGSSNRRPGEFFDEVVERTGLIFPVDTLRTRYRYIHRSFREVLCALFLAGLPEDEQRTLTASRIAEPLWADVFVLFAGMSAAPDDVLYALSTVDESAAVRAMAEMREVNPETAIKVLTLSGDSIAERRMLFRQLEEKVTSPDVLIGVLESLIAGAKSEVRRVDLFFVDEIARRVSTPRGGRLRRALFDYLPRPSESILSCRCGGAECPYWCDIPAGEFPFGGPRDDPERAPWIPIERSVSTSAFRIGRIPVTNEAYWHFDSRHPVPTSTIERLKDSSEILYHPVVYVSWYEAYVYTLWISQVLPGVALPTEVEWEKAASWDVSSGRKRRYPWGDTWDSQRCNTWESGPNMTTPVHAYPEGASPCGALDMLGNVWEWCADWFCEGLELDQVLSGFGASSAGRAERKVDRGAGWYHDVGRPTSFLRAADDPGDQFAHCGFRLKWGGHDCS